MTAQGLISIKSGKAPTEGGERREAERVIAYWEDRLAKSGDSIAALDFASLHTEEWSHRFVITSDAAIEGAALLLYGADFARLLDLPSKGRPQVPMIQQLPKRFGAVFMQGCSDAIARSAAVRVEGEVAQEDGRRERFRAAFIPVGPVERPVRFTFGAFNSQAIPETL